MKPILIMSLKISMGQIDYEKQKIAHSLQYMQCIFEFEFDFWKHDSSRQPVSRCLLPLEGAVYLDDTGNSIVTLQFTDQATHSACTQARHNLKTAQ